jgi:hypothetical protein
MRLENGTSGKHTSPRTLPGTIASGTGRRCNGIMPNVQPISLAPVGSTA